MPNVGWQIAAYFLLTSAEVLVSVTALEFSYTQAPQRLKSVVMSLYLLSISAGNWLTAAINQAIVVVGGEDGIRGPTYYAIFAGLMFAGAGGFAIATRGYRERLVLQSR